MQQGRCASSQPCAAHGPVDAYRRPAIVKVDRERQHRREIGPSAARPLAKEGMRQAAQTPRDGEAQNDVRISDDNDGSKTKTRTPPPVGAVGVAVPTTGDLFCKLSGVWCLEGTQAVRSTQHLRPRIQSSLGVHATTPQTFWPLF